MKKQRGSIKKGDPPRNPEGKNGFSSGLQPFHKRAEHYLEKFTASEIQAIAANPARLDEFPTWDAIVLKRLAASLDGRRDERDEVGFLVDRKEGKAIVRQETRIINGWSDLKDEELERLIQSGESS